MAGFKTPQCRLTVGTRMFHFVAYEATPGNPRRHEDPTPAMWYLMVPGRRCAVMPYTEDQPEREVERGLTRWVKANAIDDDAPPPQPAVAAQELWEE